MVVEQKNERQWTRTEREPSRAEENRTELNKIAQTNRAVLGTLLCNFPLWTNYKDFNSRVNVRKPENVISFWKGLLDAEGRTIGNACTFTHILRIAPQRLAFL